MTKKETPETSIHNPIECFLDAFNKNEIDSKRIVDSIERLKDKLKSIIPEEHNIQNFQIFTHPQFAPNSSTIGSREFSDCCLVFFEYCAYLFISIRNQISLAPYSDTIRNAILANWEEGNLCPLFQDLVRAAYGIAAEETDLINQYYVCNSLKFLVNSILLHISLTQSPVYQQVLEVAGEIFVLQPIRKCPQVIHEFDAAERHSFSQQSSNSNNSKEKDNHLNDFQVFLRVVECISAMRLSDDFSISFLQEGQEFIHFLSNVSPPYFTQLLNTLTALTRNENIANSIFQHLQSSSSDTLNLRHFYRAIRQISSNVSSDVQGKKLTESETLALEAILSLYAAMFKVSSTCREMIAGQNEPLSNSSTKYRSISNKTENTLGLDSDEIEVGSHLFSKFIFDIIFSPVPTSLKGKCFDVLSALSVDETRANDIWEMVISSQILTPEMVEAGHGGIMTDLENIEAPAHNYPLTRSFIRFLSSILLKVKPTHFAHFHIYLIQQVLFKLRDRLFSHPFEKWAIVSELCQCETNYSIYGVKVAKPLFQSFLCDRRFGKTLINLCAEDEAPCETLLCIFRLFLIISEHQMEFRDVMSKLQRSSFMSLSEQFTSWSSSIIKVIQCVESYDLDLQQVSINLMQNLALSSPNVIQTVFCNIKGHAIRSFSNLILTNGSPNRTLLLKALVSLGNSSIFLQYVFGYDISNRPKSIAKSKISKGILQPLLEAMSTIESEPKEFINPIYFSLIKESERMAIKDEKNQDGFLENALKLLNLMADNWICVTPLMNAIRFSKFNILKPSNSSYGFDIIAGNVSLLSKGLFLQLLAREASESERTSFSINTLEASFNTLFNSTGFPLYILSFIQKTDSSDDEIEKNAEIEVARGLYEIFVTYFNNSNIKMIISDAEKWHITFYQCLRTILISLPNYSDPEAASFLSKAAAFLMQTSFIGPLGQYRSSLFSIILNSLDSVKTIPDISMGLFSILSILFSSPLHQSDQKLSLESNEIIKFTKITVTAMKIGAPVCRALACTAAESLLQYLPNETISDILLSALSLLQQDWNEYDRSRETGNVNGPCFSLSAKFSLFLRSIHLKSDTSGYITENEIFASLLLREGILQQMAHPTFWEKIPEAFSTPIYQGSEQKLKTASKAISIITALCCRCQYSDTAPEAVRELFRSFWTVLKSIFYFNHYLTPMSMKFLQGIVDMIAVCKWLWDDPEFQVKEPLKALKEKFKDTSSITSMIRKGVDESLNIDDLAYEMIEIGTSITTIINGILNNSLKIFS